MKHIIAILALFCMPAMAYAQTASNSIGTAAQSGSYSGVANNFASSPSTQTIRSAPSMAAPTLYSMSTCATPISGGVSVVGFGASAGTVISSHSCEQEQEDAIYVPLLARLGRTDMAMALLCENKDVQDAGLAVNQPGPTVKTRGAAPAATSVSLPMQQSTPAAPTMPVKPICHEEFVPPSNINGAGYMESVCQ